ncbi:MAG: histidinol-phosphatase HisJ family protein [Actinomycetota bacterium]
MISDYHVHTALCGHARGTLDELVAAAIDKGFAEIGIADHMPLLYDDNPDLAMAREQLPRYVEQVLELKERSVGRITVRLGIEADYDAATMEERIVMMNAYPWDYVIGSVHVLDGWIFDDPRNLDRYRDIDLDEFYLEYLYAVESMVQTGLYDIIAHADLAKKFDMRASIDLRPHYRRLLEKVKAAGMCYEINTAGLRWPVAEMYPEPEFVRIAAELGVPVTLGSDSHSPDDIGRDFDRALELVRSAGYAELATFDGRKMGSAPI